MNTDTGDETFTVTSRAHNDCHETGHCGTMDCPAQQPDTSLLDQLVAAAKRLGITARKESKP